MRSRSRRTSRCAPSTPKPDDAGAPPTLPNVDQLQRDSLPRQLRVPELLPGVTELLQIADVLTQKLTAAVDGRAAHYAAGEGVDHDVEAAARLAHPLLQEPGPSHS